MAGVVWGYKSKRGDCRWDGTGGDWVISLNARKECRIVGPADSIQRM